MSGPTSTLARFIVATRSAEIPPDVLHEAKRTLINLLAVSLSASVDRSVLALESWDGRARRAEGEATIIGRGRAGLERAALVNGYLAHLQDYDDTHFPTILHPSAPTWPAALAAGEYARASGRATLEAFAVGAEVACRIALSVHPWHYDAGWHITGTVGGFGAAAAAARLLGLTELQTAAALGLAGTHAAGVRESFGTNGKALHVGHAAASGLRAALLAREDFTGPTEILEGRRGFWAVLSPGGHDASTVEAVSAAGERWELLSNGLKPFANGVVSHPLQHAVIELRNRHAILPEQVTAIEARVHPLVLELMNRPDPAVGLEGKFSRQHCAAVALIDGAGHEAQFTDERVRDPRIAALRRLVHASADPGVSEDEVHVTIRLVDGVAHSIHLQHATGSPENPMRDTQLEAKFRVLAGEVLGSERAGVLLEATWRLEEAPNLAAFAGLAGASG